jgi:hypothetical protein
VWFVSLSQRVSDFFAFELVGKLTNLLKIPAIAPDILRNFVLNQGCCAPLIVNALFQPVSIGAETVEPITGRNDGVDQAIETKIAEKKFHIFAAGPDFLTDRFTGGFAREVQTALLVKNTEGRIDAGLKAPFTKDSSTETVDRRNRRDRQETDGPHPLSRLCVKRGANPLTHFGRGFFGKGDRNNAEWIDATLEQFDIHLDKLPGLPRPRARQYNGISIERHE